MIVQFMYKKHVSLFSENFWKSCYHQNVAHDEVCLLCTGHSDIRLRSSTFYLHDNVYMFVVPFENI